MKVIGIIAEYNPFHNGHKYHIETSRRQFSSDGEETAVVCVMSGNFVQRGEPAALAKHVRAAAALAGGADLVLELPLPWAVSSAESFALGAVDVLNATGIVDVLSFGSECGNLDALSQVASFLTSEDFSTRLQPELANGHSFPVARTRTVAAALGKNSALLRNPNDILGIEYLKALYQLKSPIQPMPISRYAAGHDGEVISSGIASASKIRSFLNEGKLAPIRPLMPNASYDLLKEELSSGRAPATLFHGQRGILARLRGMDEMDFARLPDCTEGLHLRFLRAARHATSVDSLLEEIQTRRYPRSRIRRILLSAYLGITAESRPDRVPYLRVLGMNQTGRQLLHQMRRSATLPILIKPAHAKQLPPASLRLFELEAKSTDFYLLCQPDLSQSSGGKEWITGPVVLK